MCKLIGPTVTFAKSVAIVIIGIIYLMLEYCTPQIEVVWEFPVLCTHKFGGEHQDKEQSCCICFVYKQIKN